MSKKKKWSEEEVEFIKVNFKNMTYEEIGVILGRTKKSVTHMGASLNLTREAEIGDVFNRLTIIDKEVIFKYDQNITIAHCKCSCGNNYSTKLTNIIKGKSISCGCWKAEKASSRLKESNYEHGMSKTKIYGVWAQMKNRCSNKNDIAYKDYGGRGISVCKEWLDFIPFFQWAIENGYKDQLTIDRINVNGNYEPENCRWVDRKVQANNRRNNRIDTVKITAFGETKAVREWLQDSRCSVSATTTICYRIGSGWTPEEAISKPSERK